MRADAQECKRMPAYACVYAYACVNAGNMSVTWQGWDTGPI